MMPLSPTTANSPNMANNSQRIQQLQFDNVIYTTPKKVEILHSVCGKIKAGHVTAIMGPSGAGKTTLFNCLSGRVGKESWSGRVTINGREISRAALRKAVAVVTQTDTMYETATPREIFATNLKLRSPHKLPAEEIKATVQGVVERLQLTACADTRVGTPGLVRGLSGGERKRTNIGSEIINDPSIILLDEPTTGLDSVSALKVMQLLHSLAHQDGRAIVLTIHQPSSEIFELIDDLFLLVEGSIVYGGPANQVLSHFEQLGHPSPLHYNPADHIIEVLEEEANERAGTGRQSKFVEAWNTMNATTVAVSEYTEAVGEEPDTRVSAPFMVQFPTLIVRAWRNIARDRKTLMGMFIQNFFFLLLVLLIYWNLDETRDGIQDRQGLFLMLCANCLFGNTTPACAAFARERAIFIREQQTAAYSTTLYLLTKIVAEAPFRVLIPVITTSIMYGPLTLAQTAKGYFLYIGILALLGFTGTGLGMFVAAITPDLQVATAIIPLILVPMFLGAGLIVSAERLRGFWTWLKYYSLMRYGNTVLLKNEFGQIGCIKCDNAAITCGMNDSSCLNTGAKVLEYLKLENDHIWLQFLILGCVAVASIIFANLGLMLMARRKRSA